MFFLIFCSFAFASCKVNQKPPHNQKLIVQFYYLNTQITIICTNHLYFSSQFHIFFVKNTNGTNRQFALRRRFKFFSF